MTIAFLSDIHANLPALRSALAIAGESGAERVVVCGDIVGDGPFPQEAVELLQAQHGLIAVRGNVDRKVLRLAGRKRRKLKKIAEEGSAKSRKLAWTALQLADDAREWLEALPPHHHFRVEDREILVVHGSPLGDTDYIYPSLTKEGLAGKLAGYEGPPPDLLAAGHSHIPFAKSLDQTIVVNCGSVGLPADGDPRGSLVIVNIGAAGAPAAQLIRFSYQIEETITALEERGVPGADVESYRAGVKPR